MHEGDRRRAGRYLRGAALAALFVALVVCASSAGDVAATAPPPGFDIYATGIDMNQRWPVTNTALTIGGGSPGIDPGDLQSASGNVAIGDSTSPIGVGHVCLDIVVDEVPNGNTPSGGVGIAGTTMTVRWDGAIAGVVGFRAGSKNIGRTRECVTDTGGTTISDPDDFLYSFEPPAGDTAGDGGITETYTLPNPSNMSPNTTGSFRTENLFDDLDSEVGPGRLAQLNFRCLSTGSTALTLDDADSGGGSTVTVRYATPTGGIYTVHSELEATLYCNTTPPADADGDGVTDAGDNCPGVANAGQADADIDGVGDVCDNCPAASNSAQTNSDADVFGNACDNCPTVTNIDQQNTDGDATGNACEQAECVNTPNWWTAPAGDDDCDGFRTAIETDPDIATDPNDACANTATPNDEADDRWPADFSDNQLVNTLDLTGYATRLNTPPVTALDRRHDLNQNGLINTLDLVIYAAALNHSCVPPP